MSGVEFSTAAFQIGAEDGGIPAAARRNFDHGVGRLDAKERQRLDWVAPFVARLLLLQPPGARDGRLERRLRGGGLRHRPLRRDRRWLAAPTGRNAKRSESKQKMACFHVFS
jgi:hypothetical protein